ncbi:hypothetical protein [Neobacillus drentensis]|uniref:hypothetical protein n=1 Tax=Neobacillus drentensis TaxID=220684 RepID=UPI003000EDF5
MKNTFEISWVALCRIFGTLDKDEYDEKLNSTLLSLYNQCSNEQKNKLEELYPELIKRISEAMINTSYGSENSGS